MTLSAVALKALVSIAMAVALLAPIVLVALLLRDLRRRELW